MSAGSALAQAPAVTALGPDTGSVSGGTTVTIDGAFFTGATAVNFGGVPAASFVVSSDNAIDAVSPAGTGTVDVTVTSPGGTSASAGTENDYFYTTQPIRRAGYGGNTSALGGGAPVTFIGENLSSATVTVGGVPATVTFNSDTQITISPPGGPPGYADTTITTPFGSITFGFAVNYIQPVTLSAALSTPSIGIGGTSRLTFTMTKFDSFGHFALKFATALPSGVEVAATPNAASTTCTGVSFAPSAGATTIALTDGAFSGASSCTFSVDVTATTPGTKTITPGDVSPPESNWGGVIAGVAGSPVVLNVSGGAPVVTAISPTSGPTTGGTTVVITGSDFTGATAVTFGVNPSSGLTIDSDTQITVVSPAGTGTVDVTITTGGGTSSVNAADQFTYIAAPLTITSITPPSGATVSPAAVTIVGTNFSASGNIVTFDGAAGSVTSESATSITITPPDHGAGAVDVIVTNTLSQSASVTSGYTYIAPPLANAVSATVGFGSSNNPIGLNITGGTPTSVATPGLPSQGTVSISGLSITYTPTAGYSGPDSFTYTATNAGGTSAPATVSLTVTPVLAVVPASLPNGVNGAAYTTTISATGGTGAGYTFAVTSGSPPGGLTLAAGGDLTGTPNAAGSSTFTVTVTDSVGDTAARAYTLVINPGAVLTVNPASLSNGTNGTAYNETISATGGTGIGQTFAVTSGSLPGGLTLAAGGGLSGTPNAAGSSTFTVTATDSAGNTGLRTYTVVISPGVVVTVNPSSLSNGTNSTAYSATLSATGGTGTGYTFAVTSGSLPGGLTLSTGGGLSGTPNAAGSSTFTVTATDSAGNIGLRAYILVISPGAVLTVNPASLPNGTNGTAYNATIGATGGTGAGYTFAVSAGSLPGGLTLAAGGGLTGTPNAAGSSTFTVTATDSAGNTGLRAYTLVISPGAVLTVNPASLPNGTNGTAYNATIIATGGTGAGYTFAVTSGSLPGGLTLAAGGDLSGTPNAAGTSTFTVTATDSAGNTGVRIYTLVINPGAVLTINPATLPAGHDRVAYNQTLTATGGAGTGYTYSVTVGALPSGLTLSTAGSLSGTPQGHGTFTFTVRVQDSAGNFGIRAYTLVIVARPDPSLDPQVREMIGAQFNMSQRFAETQISNVSRHIEGLGAGCQLDIDDPTRCRDLGITFWMAAASDRSRRFSQDTSTLSATIGVDYWLSPHAVIGLAGGLASNDQSIGTVGSRLNGDARTVSAYANAALFPGFNVSGLYGWGTQSASLDRRVTADGSMVTGDRDGALQFGSIGMSLDRRVGELSILPYARIDYVKIDLDPYAERGASIYALSYEGSDRDITSLVAGMRVTLPPSSIGEPFVRIETRSRDLGGFDQWMSYADNPVDRYRVQDAGGRDQVWSGGVGTEVRMGLGFLRLETGFSGISDGSFQGLGVRAEYKISAF
ncbi:putative Ig domain-containing protein [uncultured Brevundimonas sp.]|uniref:putative Ig domain-containing protein n=1 Tax=uncultured Brevundimonas sp. TaxID=213418 RepID=UPI0030EBB37B|tara:strand:- start:2456 stop:6727 length:4272 start_codon:yes stop_codon:yes gene_type:complete